MFADAVAAFHELLDGEHREAAESHELEVAAPDRAALLAEFLTELLFLVETESFVPVELSQRRALRAPASHDCRGLSRRPPAPGQGGDLAPPQLRARRRADVARAWCSMSEAPWTSARSTKRCGRSRPATRAGHARARPHLLRPRAAPRDPGRPLAGAASERRHAARASSTRRWRCPTSTRATASRSARSRPPQMPDGVVSPGGVGYDINCGVRLLAAPVHRRRARRAPPHARTRDRAQRAGRHRKARARSASSTAASTGSCARDRARCSTSQGIGSEQDIALTESRRLHRRRRGGGRVRARPGAWRRPARHARLGEPLHRGATGREGPRRSGGGGIRARGGTGDGADPLRLARARPPGLHRLRQADGRRAGPARDRASRPPALLRAARLGRGPCLSRRDGRRRQLRVGEPAGDRRSDPELDRHRDRGG